MTGNNLDRFTEFCRKFVQGSKILNYVYHSSQVIHCHVFFSQEKNLHCFVCCFLSANFQYADVLAVFIHGNPVLLCVKIVKNQYAINYKWTKAEFISFIVGYVYLSLVIKRCFNQFGSIFPVGSRKIRLRFATLKKKFDLLLL